MLPPPDGAVGPPKMDPALGVALPPPNAAEGTKKISLTTLVMMVRGLQCHKTAWGGPKKKKTTAKSRV
jgi:hypothetical protein